MNEPMQAPAVRSTPVHTAEAYVGRSLEHFQRLARFAAEVVAEIERHRRQAGAIDTDGSGPVPRPPSALDIPSKR